MAADRTLPHRRVVAARWLLAAATASLLLGCRTNVLHDMPEAEANRIVAVLQDHGIYAEKVIGDEERNTWSISVPRDATSRAWSVLEEYKLPRAPERRFADVFGKSKLVVTPKEEQALFLEALQGELSQTVESIDGVIDARVHLVLPERDLGGQMRGQPKASVVVEFLPSPQGQPPIQRVEVQQVVANAVEGLAPADVAVVLKPASIAAPKSARGVDLDAVRSAGLVLERGSVPRFKVYVATATMLLAVLGFLLLLEGRANNRLRQRLQAAERELRQAQRGAAMAQKAG
jgi:type III secretion protein J